MEPDPNQPIHEQLKLSNRLRAFSRQFTAETSELLRKAADIVERREKVSELDDARALVQRWWDAGRVVERFTIVKSDGPYEGDSATLDLFPNSVDALAEMVDTYADVQSERWRKLYEDLRERVDSGALGEGYDDGLADG